MTNQDYYSILERLPIEDPTPQDMAMLCPHLTQEEAVKAFMIDSGYVACPPLRVRGSFRVVHYHKEPAREMRIWSGKDGDKDRSVVTITKHFPAQIDREWKCVSRASKSYADSKLHGEVFPPYKYAEKAAKFAEDNWGDDLIVNNCVSGMQLFIQDPIKLSKDNIDHGCPRTKMVLYMTLGRALKEIHAETHKPKSELLDEVIFQMTLDGLIWSELIDPDIIQTNFNCAHCGAGLGLTSCTGCCNKFRDDSIRCGWNTPLSRKMVAFLRENGYEFKVDPEIAWRKERNGWESSRIQQG